MSSLAIYFASFEIIVSLVNHEADRSERGLKREEIRVTVTILGHCGEYCEGHYEEHYGEHYEGRQQHT